MPRDDRLFGDVVVPSIRVGSRRWYTVPLSVIVHVTVIAAIVIIPLVATNNLPRVDTSMKFFSVQLPAPVPPPAAPKVVETKQPVTTDMPVPLDEPAGIPKEEPFDVAQNMSGDTVVQGIPFDSIPVIAPPPEPATPPEPVRIGGEVRPPQRLRNVAPIYPAIALTAHVEGIVIVEAVIDEEGRVSDARVLRSIPLLDEAALAAVRQWQYTPTLLNRRAVPVVMTVTVQFKLQ